MCFKDSMKPVLFKITRLILCFCLQHARRTFMLIHTKLNSQTKYAGKSTFHVAKFYVLQVLYRIVVKITSLSCTVHQVEFIV